jgi:hypothetical protein
MGSVPSEHPKVEAPLLPEEVLLLSVPSVSPVLSGLGMGSVPSERPKVEAPSPSVLRKGLGSTLPLDISVLNSSTDVVTEDLSLLPVSLDSSKNVVSGPVMRGLMDGFESENLSGLNSDSSSFSAGVGTFGFSSAGTSFAVDSYPEGFLSSSSTDLLRMLPQGSYLSPKYRWVFRGSLALGKTISDYEIVSKKLLDIFSLKSSLLYSKKYAFQLEAGEKGGALHVQGYFNLQDKKRFSQLSSILSPLFGLFYLRPCESETAAITYCTKLETRVAGPTVYPTGIQGRRFTI